MIQVDYSPFKKDLIFTFMCVHASVDAVCVEAVVSHLTWVLGSELRSSGRAVKYSYTLSPCDTYFWTPSFKFSKCNKNKVCL